MAIGKVAPVQPPDIECGHEVVKVIVGPQKKEFNIYKNLICAASKFFHAALNSNFIEGAEHTVTLPEEDPRMFQLVHTWLHSGRVADGVTTYMEDDACSGDRFWWRMYMMGDRLMLDRLRVLAVAQIQNIFTSKRALVPSSEFIKDLFDSALLPGLETYIIKHVVYWLKNSKTPSDWRDLPDAHLKFGQALAKEQIEDMAQKHGHPEVSASLIAMHKPLSPWKIAAVEVNHWRQPASCAVDRTKLLVKVKAAQREDGAKAGGKEHKQNAHISEAAAPPPPPPAAPGYQTSPPSSPSMRYHITIPLSWANQVGTNGASS